MRELESELCQIYGVSPDALMELAGLTIARHASHANVGVIVGPGNNGGDALVAARHLLDGGAKLRIFSLQTESPKLKYLIGHGATLVDAIPELEECDYIIDGLLGYGFKPPLAHNLATYIRELNSLEANVISVDLPSGLSPEGPVYGPMVKASATVFLGLPKLNAVTGIGLLYSGWWSYYGLGFETFFRSIKTGAYLVEDDDIRELIRSYIHRPYHKRLAGIVTAVVGSPKYFGAALLVVRTLIKMGTGLIYIRSHESVEDRMVATEPQVIKGEAPGVFVIGPGLEDLNLALAYASRPGPKVLDASALVPEVLKEARDALITPHEGEAARLLDTHPEFIRANRYDAAKALYDRFGCVVVLKGPGTIVYDGHDFFVIPATAYQLATGGTGDVLSGFIGHLLSRGMPLRDAAIVGCYVHAEVAKMFQHGLELDEFITSLARTWWKKYEYWWQKYEPK
ncbi:NAD(P)H-hydrate epimerase [Coprothermobacteraceae bacterium]|nr:NAD(P)H-hydrate epimerase [Coprothermobacteraceae bacterium]